LRQIYNSRALGNKDEVIRF